MQIVPLWLGTIVASKVLEVSDVLYMYKVAADNGYKIDGEKIAPISITEEDSDVDLDGFISLVPVMNVFAQLERSVITRTDIEQILRTFNEFGAMDEMTKKEKEKYQEKPTSYNAFKISQEAYMRYQLPLFVKVNETLGVIDLLIGPTLDDVLVTGTSEALDVISDEDLLKIVNMVINSYEDRETLIQEVEKSNIAMLEEAKEQLRLVKMIQKIAKKESKLSEKEAIKTIQSTSKELEQKKRNTTDETQLIKIEKEKQQLMEYKQDVLTMVKSRKQNKDHNPLQYLDEIDEKKNHLLEMKERIQNDESLKKTGKKRKTTSEKIKK